MLIWFDCEYLINSDILDSLIKCTYFNADHKKEISWRLDEAYVRTEYFMSGVSDFPLSDLLWEDREGLLGDGQDDAFPSFMSEDSWSWCSVIVQLGSSL